MSNPPAADRGLHPSGPTARDHFWFAFVGASLFGLGSWALDAPDAWSWGIFVGIFVFAAVSGLLARRYRDSFWEQVFFALHWF